MTDELENLAAAAAAVDATAAAPEVLPGAEAAPPPDVAAEMSALLVAVAGLLTPLFPSLATIYTKETCDRLGTASAPVMDKYGLSVGGLFDRWGAEITLAATAFPVAIATAQGIRADLAQRQAQQDATPVRVAHPGDFVPPHAGNYADERAGQT